MKTGYVLKQSGRDMTKLNCPIWQAWPPCAHSALSVQLFEWTDMSEADSLIQALLGGVRVVVQNGLRGGGIVVGLKRRHLISQVIGYAEWITGAQV